jgi:hypothetical protein
LAPTAVTVTGVLFAKVAVGASGVPTLNDLICGLIAPAVLVPVMVTECVLPQSTPAGTVYAIILDTDWPSAISPKLALPPPVTLPTTLVIGPPEEFVIVTLSNTDSLGSGKPSPSPVESVTANEGAITAFGRSNASVTEVVDWVLAEKPMPLRRNPSRTSTTSADK